MTVEARPAPAGGSTARRTLTAIVGIPLFLVPLYLGEWVWTSLLVIIALLGASEWIALTRKAGLAPAPAVIFPGTVLIYGSAVFRPDLLAASVALLVMTAGSPASITATTLFVVPRSIPMTRPISCLLLM